MYNISVSDRIFRLVLSLGLIAVVFNSTGPLGALVYLPFISIYAGVTAFIGLDPVNAIAQKLGEHFSGKHGHSHHGEWVAH